jgi:hypothetical protein
MRPVLLGFFLLVGCGDDSGGTTGDGGGGDGGDGPAGDASSIDASVVCGEIPAGGPAPSPALGSGWARGSSGSGNTLASIARGGDGALFLSGRLRDGDVSLGGVSAVAIGQEAFVAKLASTGAPQWIRATSGSDDVFAGFHGGAAGDGVAFGGGFAGSLTLNFGQPSETTLTTAATEAPFLARWNGDGSLAWAKTATSTGTGRVVAAAGLADGQVWACGELTGTLTLGPGETNQTVLTATDYDAWVGRFAAATGNLVWGVRLGDTGADACRDLEVLADGSVVTGGVQAGELVVRGFDAAGAPRFEKHATGTDVEVTDLALFADGSFAVSGLFSGGITFGAGEPAETTLPAPPGAAGFVARFAADGTLQWARLATRPVNSVAARTDGSVWAVGSTLNPGVVLNECQPDRLTLAMFDEDAFLARWDAAGRIGYATQQGNYWSQFGTAVADIPGVGAAISGAYIYGATFYSGTGSQVMFQESTGTNNTHVFVLGVNAP